MHDKCHYNIDQHNIDQQKNILDIDFLTDIFLIILRIT